ncbi:MAG TPA: hypothetical protein VF729_10850 [Solirubrobacterales bacterium]
MPVPVTAAFAHAGRAIGAVGASEDVEIGVAFVYAGVEDRHVDVGPLLVFFVDQQPVVCRRESAFDAGGDGLRGDAASRVRFDVGDLGVFFDFFDPLFGQERRIAFQRVLVDETDGRFDRAGLFFGDLAGVFDVVLKDDDVALASFGADRRGGNPGKQCDRDDDQ